MSDDHDQPTTISLVPTVLLFAGSSVAAIVVMLLVMIYNHNGGF